MSPRTIQVKRPIALLTSLLALSGATATTAFSAAPAAAAEFRTQVSVFPAAVTDSQGASWSAAQGFVGGSFWKSHADTFDIKATSDDRLYRGEMWGMSGWSTPVPSAGEYDVTLRMREAYFSAVGARVFSVSAEGATVLKDFDIIKTVGQHTAVDRTYRVQVTDGRLNLGFSATVDEPVISAIKVSQVPAAVTPAPSPSVSAAPASVQIAGRNHAVKGVDVAGAANELIAYTPASGGMTADRPYWLDVTVVGGVVTAKSSYPRTGRTVIPANGYVLSGHNTSADWLVGVQVGQAVKLLDAKGQPTSLGGGSTAAPSPTTSTPAPSPTTSTPAPVTAPPATVAIADQKHALNAVNAAGEANQLIAYTPSWDSATANRAYWLEVTVVGGVVTAKSSYPRSGPTVIPANGYVLSGHNTAADWLIGAQVGQRVQLLDVNGQPTAIGSGTPSVSPPSPTTTPTPAPTSTPAPTTGTAWPAKMIAAYKKMFNGDPGAMSSYSSNVNVVFLAFAAQHTGPLRLVGYSGQGKTSLMADIKARQASGGKVSVSIGGAGNPINTSNTTGFVNEFTAIGTDLNFVPDGIDWDLEHWNNTSQIVAISKALKAKYGAKFGVTYSVGGVGSQADIDNRVSTGVALHQAGALDAFSWQLYDTVVGLSTAKWRLGTIISAGIPASKVTVGMMVGSSDKYWDNNECLTYMRDIKATMGLTKTALWTEGWSAADTRWANDMKSVIG
ncbi:MAG TPA: malectin domain-containing carbohydrate-binding protein [Dermatophilaceae bacterium]|nr:malectin domain-containing carbohydrate-binding protein [Dermatophilaceae bacterium]